MGLRSLRLVCWWGLGSESAQILIKPPGFVAAEAFRTANKRSSKSQATKLSKCVAFVKHAGLVRLVSGFRCGSGLAFGGYFDVEGAVYNSNKLYRTPYHPRIKSQGAG